MIVLKKWFDPVDQMLDGARQLLKEKYRVISRMVNIDNEGPGMRIIYPTEDEMNPEKIKVTEDQLEEQMGMPVRIVTLNPMELREAKLIWEVVVNPKEKKSSELSKMMFGTMSQQAMVMGLRLNQNYMEDRFAEVWDEDPTKMYSREEITPEQLAALQQQGAGAPGMPQGSPQGAPQGGQGGKVQATMPNVKLPTAAQAATNPIV
jgi:hypothetical protein